MLFSKSNFSRTFSHCVGLSKLLNNDADINLVVKNYE